MKKTLVTKVNLFRILGEISLTLIIYIMGINLFKPLDDDNFTLHELIDKYLVLNKQKASMQERALREHLRKAIKISDVFFTFLVPIFVGFCLFCFSSILATVSYFLIVFIIALSSRLNNHC